MVGNYKVITLCGSTRFKDEFMEAQKRLTLAGVNVNMKFTNSTNIKVTSFTNVYTPSSD